MGAHVISVVSTDDKARFVSTVGSDEVVLADGFKDVVKELTGGRGVDLIVDPVGGDRFTDSLRTLAPLGRLLVIGFTAGDIPTVKVNRLLLNNIASAASPGVPTRCPTSPRPQGWDVLTPYLDSGVVDPPIAGTYPLARTAEAVAQLDDRAVLGKVVVDPTL
ncbi:zinc-binding dehydrogenase [Saccharomonospora sp. CUA-673]|uniref:zinc-binding dehydrogenase n=1 Tax=Saccharomonospora sp. CUA-673 TaxID=1904969 RepID=UPI0035165F27